MKLWKERLNYSGSQMAQILGLKSSRRWRELVDENKPQGIAPANLFMGVALTILPQKEINRVLEEMREIGAVIDLDAAPDSSELAGDHIS
ncbi:hypothetical protein [Paraburkholderia caledonica]|uniref:Transcriptional regulator n=1 Tax=Paraburkholderia caledonica TaxID=134536 RepID=A0ABU1L279_9BURK|nr:hypothetical protein [Paraburkholderia caledonica]MDR6377330.1 hypothetical protein [Paraburkholderia caledonica]